MITTQLGGKTALVAGAGREIGRAIAVGLAEAGVELVLIARTESRLAATVAAIDASGGSSEVHTVAGDVGDDKLRRHVVEPAPARGPVDILINYAATAEPLGPMNTISAAELRRAFGVNAYRPGAVNTAMQAWIRDQDPARVGAGLHERFVDPAGQDLIAPEGVAAALLTRLASDATGEIWDVNDELVVR